MNDPYRLEKNEYVHKCKSFEIREKNGKKIVEGTAIVYGVPIEAWGDGDLEVIEQGAATEALAADNDIHFVRGHDIDLIMASTRNKSLKLYEDERGVHFEAELSETNLSNDLYIDVKSGLINQMSFAFRIQESVTERIGEHKWLFKITKIEMIREISAVTDGAYSATTIEARKKSLKRKNSIIEQDILAAKINWEKIKI